MTDKATIDMLRSAAHWVGRAAAPEFMAMILDLSRRLDAYADSLASPSPAPTGTGTWTAEEIAAGKALADTFKDVIPDPTPATAPVTPATGILGNGVVIDNRPSPETALTGTADATMADVDELERGGFFGGAPTGTPALDTVLAELKTIAADVVTPCAACVSEYGVVKPDCAYCGGTGHTKGETTP